MAAPYEYDPVVLLDTNGNLKPGGAVKAYPPETSNFDAATPLALTNLSGTPLENDELVAGDVGVTSGFRVVGEYTRVALYAPGVPVIIVASVKGIDEKASDALASAQASAQQVAEFLENPPTLGGVTTLADLNDVTPIGQAVGTALTDVAARAAIGAGTSSLVLGTSVGSAARGSEVLYKTGTTAQTVAPKVTFTQPPAVPVDSFTQDRIVGLLARLEAFDARAQLVAADSPTTIPDTARTGDWIAFRSDPDGGTVEPPVTVTAARRADLAGLADGVALPQSLGTGDTPLSVAPAGTQTVRLRNGLRTVEVNAGAATARWTDLALTTDEYSIEYVFEVTTAGNTTSTIYQASSVWNIPLAPGNTLSVVRMSDSSVQGSISPALALSTLASPKVYKLKVWKADAETLTHFRLYDPTGAIIWDVTKDVGTGIPGTFLWGRTGSITTGQYFWHRSRVHTVGAELV